MKYSPASAAEHLRSQGSAREQSLEGNKVTHGAHGPGGPVPRPKPVPGADKDGEGMGYRPAKAAKCLNEWGSMSDQPRAGDMKGGAKDYYGGE